MKLLPVLLMNVAIVGVALFAYEQLRQDPAPPQDVSASNDTAALLARIEALEARGRPLLRAHGPDPAVAKRLEALEAAIGMLDVTSEPTPDSDRPAKTPRRGVDPYEPTPDAIARFRKLREAVQREDRLLKSRKRIDRTLDKLALNLNDQQRERIRAAHETFESRVREIWTEVKREATATLEDGGTIDSGDLVRNTQARIQEEFAASLTDIVSQTDAEAIAAALHPSRK